MIKNKTTLLTIDIGSNAMRATFFQKRGQGFVPVLKQRFPLRLGQDVFNQGIIEDQKAEQLYQAFKELWHLCYKHHVEHILAVGTSALREAKNNQSIIHHIEKITGISIKLITGALEAKVIFEAVKKNLSLKKKNIAHIDIGGGSTEIVLAKNEKIQKVLSLPLGSVRLLQNKNLVSIQTRTIS